MTDHPLEAVFHPRSVALVGVSRTTSGHGGRGPDFLSGLLDLGFDEDHALYLVNPNADEIAGRKCYRSLLDCPDPVDHVISMVPSRFALTLAEQCAQKGVRSLHLFTAGFAESGEHDLEELEREIVGRARAGGVRVIGPNCLGLYVPSERISFSAGFPKEPGDVFVISQSGGNALDIVSSLHRRGVRFSKAVSFGNARDVNAAELFDYAAGDAETRIVVAYLEGVGDGRALFEAVKRCAREKPTIILKGGLSSAGAGAVNSHTASLAGSVETFEAMCRQAGAMRVETLEELEDLVIGVATAVRGVRGARGTMVGSGGGFSVLAADAVARHGIDLPQLSAETQAELRQHIPIAGNSIRNPIDASFVDDRDATMRAVVRIAAHAPESDFVLVTSALDGGPGGDGEGEPANAQPAIDEFAALQAESGRPVICVERGWRSAGAAGSSEAVLTAGYRRGLGLFPSVQRAARTVQLILEWRARREGLPAIL